METKFLQSFPQSWSLSHLSILVNRWTSSRTYSRMTPTCESRTARAEGKFIPFATLLLQKLILEKTVQFTSTMIATSAGILRALDALIVLQFARENRRPPMTF